MNIGPKDRICVGAIQVNVPFEQRQHYECAAWYEIREAIPGVYPLVMYRNHLWPNDLLLQAEVKAKVTDDYFPALFGGVSVSNKPYERKHLGEDRTINLSVDWLTAIRNTRCSPGSNLDYFVARYFWDLKMTEVSEALVNDFEHFNELTRKFRNNDKGAAGSLRFCSERMAKRAEFIDEVGRCITYWQAPSFQRYESNCDWAQKVQPIISPIKWG